MKTLSLIILLFGLNLAQAETAFKLKCSEPLVRLSLVKIPCIDDGKIPADFDIPNLRLNLDDLEKIFQGAESSGGHLIGPMNMPRTLRSITPFPVLFNCKATLLSDGGKSISFLSEQKFQLDGQRFSKPLYRDKWQHFLIKGNDISERNRYPVSIEPQVSLNNYKVVLGYKNNKLSISACDTNTSACAETQRLTRARKYKTQLKIIVDRQDQQLVIEKTLKVFCHRVL